MSTFTFEHPFKEKDHNKENFRFFDRVDNYFFQTDTCLNARLKNVF